MPCPDLKPLYQLSKLERESFIFFPLGVGMFDSRYDSKGWAINSCSRLVSMLDAVIRSLPQIPSGKESM